MLRLHACMIESRVSRLALHWKPVDGHTNWRQPSKLDSNHIGCHLGYGGSLGESETHGGRLIGTDRVVGDTL